MWRCMDGSDGFVCKPFIHIVFQRGPVTEHGINGCRIEDVIEALQERLLDHQGRPLACEENATALLHLESAREALLMRRRRREEQGLLNTPAPHIPRTKIGDGLGGQSLNDIVQGWVKDS
ncbi:MAG TPA: hypothetical protein VHE55_06740 [Fimbriimonadaceae bacterium]|nr:hypothetical protein [Fimbriimonadaceae bacterium]